MEFEENRYDAWVSLGVPDAWANAEQAFIDATTSKEFIDAFAALSSSMARALIASWKSDQRWFWWTTKLDRLKAEERNHFFNFSPSQAVRYVGNDWPNFRTKQFYFHSYGWDTSLVNLTDELGKMHHLMPACYIRPGEIDTNYAKPSFDMTEYFEQFSEDLENTAA